MQFQAYGTLTSVLDQWWIFFYISQSSVEESRTLAVEVGTSELPDEDHRTAADNPGVVMNEIEPSVSERRPSSDGSGRNRDRYFAD